MKLKTSLHSYISMNTPNRIETEEKDMATNNHTKMPPAMPSSRCTDLEKTELVRHTGNRAKIMFKYTKQAQNQETITTTRLGG